MTESFQLHPQLQGDTFFVKDFQLSRLLLMNDANFPWVILVPREPNMSEIFQLSSAQRVILTEESAFVGETMMRIFSGHKLNVAALGNVVAQLHVHHVVRYRDDLAWPQPIWGAVERLAYSEDASEERLVLLRDALS